MYEYHCLYWATTDKQSLFLSDESEYSVELSFFDATSFCRKIAKIAKTLIASRFEDLKSIELLCQCI